MTVDLRLGDCLVEMPKIETASIDAIITDPPYGITANEWDSEIPFSLMWGELERIAKPICAIALFGSQPFSSLLVASNVRYFKHEWVWIKNRGSNFANTVREPFKEHESVLVFSYGKWTYNKQMQSRTGNGAGRVKYSFNARTHSTNYGKFNKPNAWQGEQRVPSSWQKFNTEVGEHPNQKPVALMEYLIRTYTNEGDTVLDFTMGSGTTMVACVNTGRNGIGIEKDEGYFAIAQRRIADAQKQPALVMP